jgi:hypothetical protein
MNSLLAKSPDKTRGDLFNHFTIYGTTQTHS